MPTKTIAVRIPDALYDYLVARAEKEHRTLSNMIIDSLSELRTNEPCRVSFKNFAPTCEMCNAPIAPEEANYCYKCGRKFEGIIK